MYRTVFITVFVVTACLTGLSQNPCRDSLYYYKGTSKVEYKQTCLDSSRKEVIGFSINGDTSFKALYHNNVTTDCLYYYLNGKRKKHEEYLGGLPYNVRYHLSPKGDTVYFGNFKNGNGLLLCYDERGRIIEIYDMLHQMPLEVMHLNKKGKLVYSLTYRNGLAWKKTIYLRKGGINFIIEYKEDGKTVLRDDFYDKNGVKVYTIDY